MGDCKAFICSDCGERAFDLTPENRFLLSLFRSLFLFFLPLSLFVTHPFPLSLFFFFRSHGTAEDSGGRVGFFRNSLFPDLRNLHLSVRFCKKGDV